jgi:hypothetical protein
MTALRFGTDTGSGRRLEEAFGASATGVI